jgi:hypothetical protein
MQRGCWPPGAPDLYGDLKPGMQEHVAGHADAALQARNEKQ